MYSVTDRVRRVKKQKKKKTNKPNFGNESLEKCFSILSEASTHVFIAHLSPLLCRYRTRARDVHAKNRRGAKIIRLDYTHARFGGSLNSHEYSSIKNKRYNACTRVTHTVYLSVYVYIYRWYVSILTWLRSYQDRGNNVYELRCTFSDCGAADTAADPRGLL